MHGTVRNPIFRHLLEKNTLGKTLLTTVNDHLRRSGMRITAGHCYQPMSQRHATCPSRPSVSLWFSFHREVDRARSYRLRATLAAEPDQPVTDHIAHDDTVGMALSDPDLVDADRFGSRNAAVSERWYIC